MKTHDQLHKMLDEMSISYKTYEHVLVFTVAEANEVDRDISGLHIKNLFLRDKKKTCMWLVTTTHDVRVDLKALRHVLGAKGNLSFCKDEVLWEHLGVKPGSVTPLAVVNDANKAVKLVLDENIFKYDLVNPHPLRNDMTTSLNPQDMLKFIKKVHKEPEIIAIPAVENSIAA